jgi:hypothetical protein
VPISAVAGMGLPALVAAIADELGAPRPEAPSPGVGAPPAPAGPRVPSPRPPPSRTGARCRLRQPSRHLPRSSALRASRPHSCPPARSKPRPAARAPVPRQAATAAATAKVAPRKAAAKKAAPNGPLRRRRAERPNRSVDSTGTGKRPEAPRGHPPEGLQDALKRAQESAGPRFRRPSCAEEGGVLSPLSGSSGAHQAPRRGRPRVEADVGEVLPPGLSHRPGPAV